MVVWLGVGTPMAPALHHHSAKQGAKGRSLLSHGDPGQLFSAWPAREFTYPTPKTWIFSRVDAWNIGFYARLQPAQVQMYLYHIVNARGPILKLQ